MAPAAVGGTPDTDTPPESFHDTTSAQLSIENSSQETLSPDRHPVPRHPVPALQNAFNESIRDSIHFSPDHLAQRLSAEVRRRQLLELDKIPNQQYSRWQQRPGSKYHPLWKLIAQISYGMHLLHKQVAKSEQEVAKMLQEHVDEVDSFIEDTLADFDLAIKDLDERLQALMIPLSPETSKTFNRMLCDRVFRESIIDGNTIIERIIKRTTVAMEGSLKDVAEGQDATRELAKFLERIGGSWTMSDGNLLAIFSAMKGNSDGWLRCFDELNLKAEKLTTLMDELNSIVDEVAKRCGIASRRKTPTGVIGRRSQQPSIRVGSTTSSLHPHQRASKQMDKPLPPPPPSQQKRTPSVLHSSPPLGFPADRLNRPSLNSTTSTQTIDCLRPSPHQVTTLSPRPSSGPSPSWTPTITLDPPENLAEMPATSSTRGLGKASPDPVNAPRSPSHPRHGSASNSSTRSSTPRAATLEMPCQQHTSPPYISPSNSPPVLTPNFVTPSTSLSSLIKPSGRKIQAPIMEEDGPPQITGLGINAASFSVATFFSADTVDAIPTKPPSEPTKATTHTSVLDNSPSRTSSTSTFQDNQHSRVFTPATRTLSNSSQSSIVRVSYSDKIVLEQADGKNDVPYLSGPDSSYTSSSETPPIASPSTAQQTSSPDHILSAPFSPDELSPNAALSSHPVTWDIATPPSPTAAITALPKFPTNIRTTPSDDLIPPLGLRKPSFLLTKRPSMNNVKSLFAKKQPKKDTWLGSGGLGGFVEVRQ